MEPLKFRKIWDVVNAYLFLQFSQTTLYCFLLCKYFLRRSISMRSSSLRVLCMIRFIFSCRSLACSPETGTRLKLNPNIMFAISIILLAQSYHFIFVLPNKRSKNWLLLIETLWFCVLKHIHYLFLYETIFFPKNNLWTIKTFNIFATSCVPQRWNHA